MRLALLLLAALMVLPGCGLGAGEESGGQGVTLVVTA